MPHQRLSQMWSVLKLAIHGWSRHNVTTLGAALAYYSVFSLGPLLLIVIAVAGLAFGQDAVRGELASQFRDLLGPVGSEAVEAMLKGAANRQSGALAAIGGSILLIIAALAVVVQLKGALNTIWEVTATEEAGWITYLRTYLVSLLGVLAVGFLLAVSLVINAALAAVWSSASSTTAATGWTLLHLAISTTVLTILFAMVLKWFPDTEVRWRDAVVGAFATALLFNIGKSAIAWYIAWEGQESTYGAAASVVVLLVWVYYSAQIFLLGTEFTHAMAALKTKPSAI